MDGDGAHSNGEPSTSAAAADPKDPPGAAPHSPIRASFERHTTRLGSPMAANCFSPARRVTYSDRFIPSRAAQARLDFSMMDREVAAAEVTRSAADREDINPAYNMLLRSELLGCNCPSPISPDKATQLEQMKGTCSPAKKILRFKSGDMHSPVAGAPTQSPFSRSPVGADAILGSPSSGLATSSGFMSPRKILKAPYKVLDAPSLKDDFYLNLVDWSSQNVVAVGLGGCVYLWSAHTSKVTKLCDLSPDDSVCSVAWSQRGTYLSVGTHDGDVHVWDVAKVKKIRTMGGHRARVGTLAWSSHILSSGSRDKNILQRDVRVPEAYISKLAGHKSEVCGLEWSPDDRQLASGGNDNLLHIWSLQSTNPVARFAVHTAAVKALAWSPHQHGLLASGGGTADRCIRFWNTVTNNQLSCVDTGSQVCNLSWSKNVNEIVSTHGYSQNQIVVWKYPTMTKLATLTGHTFRVLYLATSPDGQSIVTGAGDETLRFWNVFPGARAQGGGAETSVTTMLRTQIR